MTSAGFTSKQVIAITGVTQRQLTYWCETGLLIPSHRTTGGHSRYSFTDLVALKTAKQLLDAGVSLQRIRNSIASLMQFLPGLEQPLAELSIVATGDLVLVFHRGSAFEALTGQEWILPLAELQEQADEYRNRTQSETPVQHDLFTSTPEKGNSFAHRQQDNSKARHRA